MTITIIVFYKQHSKSYFVPVVEFMQKKDDHCAQGPSNTIRRIVLEPLDAV